MSKALKTWLSVSNKIYKVKYIIILLYFLSSMLSEASYSKTKFIKLIFWKAVIYFRSIDSDFFKWENKSTVLKVSSSQKCFEMAAFFLEPESVLTTNSF